MQVILIISSLHQLTPIQNLVIMEVNPFYSSPVKEAETPERPVRYRRDTNGQLIL